MTTPVKGCPSLKTQHLRTVLAAGHTGILCLAHTKFSEGEQGVITNRVACTNGEPLVPILGVVATVLKSTVPDTSPGPNAHRQVCLGKADSGQMCELRSA